MENKTIQNPVSEPVAPVIPVVEPKSKFPFIYLFLLLLSFGLLASTAFLYYQNQQLKDMLAKYQTPSASPIPTATPDPTANWKTYTNTTQGFSFKYPPDINFQANNRGASFVDASGNFQTNLYWDATLPSTSSLEQEIITRDDCPKDISNGLIKGPIPNSLRCDYVNSHYAATYIWFTNGNRLYKAVISAINPNEQIPQENINLLNQILSTFKFSNTNVSSNQSNCLNKELGIQLVLPNQDWKCDSKEDPGAGWINLTSSIFAIQISNLGRGPFCGDMPDPSCVVTSFYSNGKLNLSLYTSNGIDSEIWESIINSNTKPLPWISIKYKDMDKQKLTASQKLELTKLLDSITSAK